MSGQWTQGWRGRPVCSAKSRFLKSHARFQIYRHLVLESQLGKKIIRIIQKLDEKNIVNKNILRFLKHVVLTSEWGENWAMQKCDRPGSSHKIFQRQLHILSLKMHNAQKHVWEGFGNCYPSPKCALRIPRMICNGGCPMLLGLLFKDQKLHQKHQIDFYMKCEGNRCCPFARRFKEINLLSEATFRRKGMLVVIPLIHRLGIWCGKGWEVFRQS